jgi:hypothetical protein
VRSAAGRRHILVPTFRVQRWSEDAALAAVRDAMAASESQAAGLTDLAIQRGCPSREPKEVAEYVAVVISGGGLVPVALPDPPPRGAYPVVHTTFRVPDWDNIRPLSDLLEKDPTIEWSWVAIEVLDHTGVPYAGLEVTLVHADGRRDRVVLDDLGRHTARAVPKIGRTTVHWPRKLELPVAAKGRPGLDGFQRAPDDIGVPRQPEGRTVTLDQMGRRYRLVVEAVPTVTEVPIDGWAQGSKVMRWGGMRPRIDGTVGTTRAALRLALWRGRGRTMAVAGHCDPLGQDADNEALSLERAVSVQLFAAGRLDEWAQHAFANASELDLRCALVACHPILGLGGASLDDALAIEAAAAELRNTAGLAADGPINVDDWRAIAELYDADLARLFATDRAGLAEIRSAVRWAEPACLALGERHPRPAEELADAVGIPALPHRRASLLVFDRLEDASRGVTGSGDEVYDGTFERTLLVVPGEVVVRVAIATPAFESIARGRAWISIGELGALEHVADADGVVQFSALAGEVIVVVAAFDADGVGVMASSGVAAQ